jgi:hypothetical protein
VDYYEQEALREAKHKHRRSRGTAVEGIILRDAQGALEKNPWYQRALANRNSLSTQATLFATMAMLEDSLLR